MLTSRSLIKDIGMKKIIALLLLMLTLPLKAKESNEMLCVSKQYTERGVLLFEITSKSEPMISGNCLIIEAGIITYPNNNVRVKKVMACGTITFLCFFKNKKE